MIFIAMYGSKWNSMIFIWFQGGNPLYSYGSKGAQIENIHLTSFRMVDRAWIGYSNQTTEGTWKWVDTGKQEAVRTYTNWNNGEPNNGGNNEDCASMDKYDGKWNDHGCEQQIHPFFCGVSKCLFIYFGHLDNINHSMTRFTIQDSNFLCFKFRSLPRV